MLLIVPVEILPAVCRNDVCPLKSNVVTVNAPPPVLDIPLDPNCKFAIVKTFLAVTVEFADILIIPVLVNVPVV